MANENHFADNIKTLRDKCGENMDQSANRDVCNTALHEALDFMKQGGPLQSQLQDTGMVKVDGNSLTFSTNLYPTEKAEKK